MLLADISQLIPESNHDRLPPNVDFNQPIETAGLDQDGNELWPDDEAQPW